MTALAFMNGDSFVWNRVLLDIIALPAGRENWSLCERNRA
jgi:hypothetical protein